MFATILSLILAFAPQYRPAEKGIFPGEQPRDVSKDP